MDSGVLLVTTLAMTHVVSTSTSFAVKDFLQDAVIGTWENAPPNSATLFLCSEESHIFFKNLYSAGFTLRLAQPNRWEDALDSIPSAAPTKIHTVFADWQCPKIDLLMRKAYSMTLMKSPNRWLVLNVTDEEQTIESCEDLAGALSGNGKALASGKAADADFVLVCRGADSLVLVDLWGHGKPTVLGKWIPGAEPRLRSDRHPPTVRRLGVGLNGHVFRTAFVITKNDSLNHLTDGVDKRNDFVTKFHYEVMHDVAKMLNSSILPVFTEHWGYYINGSWNGLVGLQVGREAEVGGTGSFMMHSRLPIQTPLNYAAHATGTFVLREPPMSHIFNIFILPFPLPVWLSIIGLLLLGYVLLYVEFRLEESGVIECDQGPEGQAASHVSRSDVLLVIFGAAFQQGSSREARGVSGRIATLSLYIGILFLYTAYSASIVVLLQSTTSNFHHFKDFLDSPIELGVHDVSYNRYYVAANNDTFRRRVYVEKLTKHGRRDPFMSLEKGLKNVLNSYYAFFAIRTEMYQVISDTFQEHEKCGLQEVDNNFVGLTYPHLTVAKWSPHAEFFRISLRKVQERGIRQRQVQKFMASKPRCMNRASNFQRISMTDCFGAFLALVGGIGFSVLLLIIEVVLSKAKHQASGS